MTNHGQKITKNIICNVSGNLIYALCQWLMTVIVVKLSDYNNAGMLSLVMSITNVFTCLALFGVRNFQVSDIKNKYSNNIYIWSRLFTCAFSFLLCFLFIQVSHYDSYLKLCIMVYMIYRIAEAFVDVLHGIDQKIWRMDIIGISFALRGILGLISFSLVLNYSKSLLLSILIMLLESVLVVIFYDFKTTNKLNRINFIFKSKEIAQLLTVCIPLAVFSVLITVIGTIPRILLEKALGTEALGIYASVASPVLIIQIAVTYIFNPFTLSSQPFFSLRAGFIAPMCPKICIKRLNFLA